MWTLESFYEEVVAYIQDGYPYPPMSEVEDFMEEGMQPGHVAEQWMDYVDDMEAEERADREHDAYVDSFYSDPKS